MPKHYIVGAGMVGCLYDYGPEAYETLDDALEGARFYLEGDEDLSEADVVRILAEIIMSGIYYFTDEERRNAGADYIELSEQEGECPAEEP